MGPLLAKVDLSINFHPQTWANPWRNLHASWKSPVRVGHVFGLPGVLAGHRPLPPPPLSAEARQEPPIGFRHGYADIVVTIRRRPATQRGRRGGLKREVSLA